jgi:hypothetical protein
MKNGFGFSIWQLSMSHHLNPLRMDVLRIFTSSMHELVGVTILLLHGMYDDVPPSLPTSMHSLKIENPNS